MKFKLTLDNGITIEKELDGDFKYFRLESTKNSYEYANSEIYSTNKKEDEIDFTSQDLDELIKDDNFWEICNNKKKPINVSRMNGNEIKGIFSDLFEEEKPKPILDEDDIDKITEELEEKFKNQ